VSFLHPDWKEHDRHNWSMVARIIYSQNVTRYWYNLRLDIGVAINRHTGKAHHNVDGVISPPFNTPEWAMACAETARGVES
jgi:hypothetical protein